MSRSNNSRKGSWRRRWKQIMKDEAHRKRRRMEREALATEPEAVQDVPERNVELAERLAYD